MADADKPFDLIKSDPLPPDSVDYEFEPPRQPMWMTCVFIFLGLNCLGGIIAVVVLLAGRLFVTQPPAIAPGSNTVTWHGKQLPDPYAELENLWSPGTQAWIASQQSQVASRLQMHEHYRSWEQWYYGQNQVRPYEVMSVASTPTATWWLAANNNNEYEVRYATRFESASGGTYVWGAMRQSQVLEPNHLYPAPDGSRLLLHKTAPVFTDPGELEMVLPPSSPDPLAGLSLSIASGGRAIWLPDSSGFWFDAPGLVPGESVTKLFLLGQTETDIPTLTGPKRSLGGASTDHQWLIVQDRDNQDTRSLYVRRNSPDPGVPLRKIWAEPDTSAWGTLTGGDRPRAYLIVDDPGSTNRRMVMVDVMAGTTTTLVHAIPGQATLLAAGETHIAVLTRESTGWSCYRYTLAGEQVQHLPLGPEWEVYPSLYPVPGTTARIGMSGITSTWRMADFDPDTGQFSELFSNGGGFKHAKPDVERVDIQASDGTHLRVTILRPRKPATGKAEPPRPTMLYVDGGRSSQTSMGPVYVYSPWVDAGGIWVSAEVRGSGDRGRDWAGSGLHSEKERAVQDVIDVANGLVSLGITSPNQLVLFGLQHGAWLHCQAALTDPTIASAVVAIAPVSDLTRITDESRESWWEREYGHSGSPANETRSELLSPYHRVDQVTSPPAFFFAVAQDDKYIDPWQTLKLAARLEARQREAPNSRPVYCHIAATGGTNLLHGSQEDWYIMNGLLTFAGLESGLIPRF